MSAAEERDTVARAYSGTDHYLLHAKVARLEEQVADIQSSQEQMKATIGDNERFKLQIRAAGWMLASLLTMGAAAAAIGRTVAGWFQ